MATEHLPPFLPSRKNYNVIIFKIVIPILVRHYHRIVPAEIKLEEGQKLWREGALARTKRRTMEVIPKEKGKATGGPAFYLIIRLQFLPFEVPFHWDILIRQFAVKGGCFPCGHRDVLQRPQKTDYPRFARGKEMPCVIHSEIPQG